MSLKPEDRTRLRAVLAAETVSFTALAEVAKLAKGTAFRGADLRDVDFGTDDLDGYDFSGADLRGADLSRARTDGLITDAQTRLPEGWWPRIPAGFDIRKVHRTLVKGEQVRATWAPFVRELNFGLDTEFLDAKWRPSQFRRPEGAGLRQPIRDLRPLRCFSNLQSLDLSGTEIKDLTPLTDLTNLRHLYLTGVPVSDFAPLSKLIGLQSLDLSGTLIRDLKPLHNLKSLKRLYLIDTNIETIQGINTISHLEILDLYGTIVSDIQPIEQLRHLRYLDIRATNVENPYIILNKINIEDLMIDP